MFRALLRTSLLALVASALVIAPAQTPRASAAEGELSLTLWVVVQGGAVPPSSFTVTAVGPTTVGGPATTPDATLQTVPEGDYTLSLLGTGPAQYGFVQLGNWACNDGPTSLPVVADVVSLVEETSVTCTATVRQSSGAITISASVDDPGSVYIGGSTKTFSGRYDCGGGYTGTFSTLTTAAPVTVTGIASGRTCAVVANRPSGSLLTTLGDVEWGDPVVPIPVVVTDQGTSALPIVYRPLAVDTVEVSGVVDGPGGYTGGTGRAFPIAFTCADVSGTTMSGTASLDLTGPLALRLPEGSTCTLSATASYLAGDFDASSYVWTAAAQVSPATFAVPETGGVEVAFRYAELPADDPDPETDAGPAAAPALADSGAAETITAGWLGALALVAGLLLLVATRHGSRA
ncbi:DUF5979 domain-containing protein [Protaetiibacter intestinalis]|uniref:Uncharacterized protein n=1 Tax=Protaetiibacter intestinalis TaxID=2419774 RepID=A0A387BBY6_9MICO|nr:DUF5979 domain-containing protein [Protaetiibacter intestinalis]AYF99218.1 hypothetical protein D7I47_13775 [Protaetiibacter intestinalis]